MRAHDGTDLSWARVKQGDEAEFGAFFNRYADTVYGHCLRRLGDWSAAEDLTSLVFLQAWRRRADVPADAVVPWLLGAANNLLRNHRRALWRHRRLVARLAIPDPVEDPSDESVERLDAARQIKDVQAALAQLPRASRQVVELVVLDQLTYEEAAMALGVPVGTVKSRLSRARPKLSALFLTSGVCETNAWS